MNLSDTNVDLSVQGLKGKTLWIMLGTRPEAIKQIPLYLEAVNRWGRERVALVNSGQHRELLRQVLDTFGVEPDVDLQIFKGGQSLSEMSAQLLLRSRDLFQKVKPKTLIVQGDTTTAAILGMAAFYEGDITLCHNEAGLRTGQMRNPFPEEFNRQVLGRIATYHFAPTSKARRRLLDEGIAPENVFETGNTGIDALLKVQDMEEPSSLQELLSGKASDQGLVLMTAHRRENQGASFEEWFAAWAQFLKKHPDVYVLYPQHPNDFAREAADRHLRPLSNVKLCAPIDYKTTCHILKRCAFVVTDSGGLQEEGASLGIPVVVCRQTSERMEAVEAGYSRLAGTETNRILEATEWAYSEWKKSLIQNRSLTWPFGRGDASRKICDHLERLKLV
jgi:UDP-N-acetylglucosamine 2-epimerase (non-hydrolysing)